MVLETLKILSGLNDKQKTVLMKTYEESLVTACKYRSLATDTVVELIVAAEKFNLQSLLSNAITKARDHNRNSIRESSLYNKMSNKSKLQI